GGGRHTVASAGTGRVQSPLGVGIVSGPLRGSTGDGSAHVNAEPPKTIFV
ncbi:unnamed protein product, partial [Sphacelaria rigidula]